MFLTRKRDRPDFEHPLLLGFSGKSKSGKTISAEYMRHKYGGVALAFADALKADCFDLNYIRGRDLDAFLSYAKEHGYDFDFHALPRANMVNPKRPEKIAWINRNKEDFRSILQVYGDFKRDGNPDFFIERTLLAINRAVDDGQIVICVDDVRYINEVDALVSIGFNIVRVQAADDVRLSRGASQEHHESETQLDSYYHSFTVANNLEPHDLYSQLDTVVEQILNKDYE